MLPSKTSCPFHPHQFLAFFGHDNCSLSDLLHSVHSVPEVIHPEILRVLLSFHIPTLELRKFLFGIA